MYFEGEATAAELAEDIVGSVTVSGRRDGPAIRHYRCEDMVVDYTLTPANLVQLIDAVLAKDITSDDLDVIGFCLEASEHFEWDSATPEGERVAETLFWLANPEINYPLTPEVLAKIRRYLLEGENTLTLADTKRHSS